MVSTLNLFETSNVTTGSREANFVWYALEQRRASESGGSPDKSGGGVEQNPSPVVSLALDATLSRKGRGEEGDRAIMGQTLPKPALRPFLVADTPILAAIFVAAIEELTGEDYNEAQQEAWASAADDEEQFGKRLASELTLIATLQNSPVGFASLKGADHIEMLYVHPSAAGQGVATALCDALEKLAIARGATKLTVDASDTAHNLFRKRGYVDQQRSTITVGDEWLANTRMQKTIGDPKPQGPVQ